MPDATAAAPKRIPTHEDIWLMKRVGPPQVSPDGRWIVVPVTSLPTTTRKLSDLWLVDAARHSSRRLDSTRRPESGVTEPGQPPHRLQRARDDDDVEQIYSSTFTGAAKRSA